MVEDCRSSVAYVASEIVFAKPEVIVPKYNLGVAGSWNFFLQNFALVSLPMMMWSWGGGN